MADNEIVTRSGQMSTVATPSASTAISESMSHAAIRIRRVAGRPGESSMPTTSALTCGVPAAVATLEASLLGDGRLVGAEGQRRLRIAHEPKRADYVRWKYQRLGAFAGDAPRHAGGHLTFETVAHPVFEDLAPFFYRPDGARHVRREDVL